MKMNKVSLSEILQFPVLTYWKFQIQGTCTFVAVKKNEKLKKFQYKLQISKKIGIF